MKVWLYYRLSRDEDEELNSLNNQRKIICEYAVQNGHVIVGESFDDNISGMHFNREGIERIYEIVEAGKIEAIIVKDLSRLGRHRTQTALFIDYLREKNVRVFSATEGIDTIRDEDDLVVGVRGLMNDYYARDIGKKVRAGYYQKQKEGIVIIPPFGYWKDKNIREIKVVEEAAISIRKIYALYLAGNGLKEIARQLGEQGHKTPAQMQMERYGKQHPNIRKYIWTYTSVKNILRDESYTGVLVNRRRIVKDGKATDVPKAEQLRHEGVYPIICREDWEQVQRQLEQRQPKCPAGQNKPRHRYAGLLACKECGNPFVPMNRYWSGNCRVEYVCKGYHRNGKEYCSPHRIHKEKLDAAVWEYMTERHGEIQNELNQLAQIYKMWALRKPILDAHISMLRDEVKRLEQEIDEIVMEKISINMKYSE